MSQRHTVLRSLHDLGLAAWFGGSMMGAIGLNGATKDIADPEDRARAAVAGWMRWAPVNAVAVIAHLVGASGLLVVNRRRAVAQAGVTAGSVAKAALTVGALASTSYSAQMGKRLAEQGRVPAAGGTTPAPTTPPAASEVQQQLRALQWVTPALTGAIVILTAQQGEQQRTSQVIRGVARRAVHGGKAAKTVGKHPAAAAKAAEKALKSAGAVTAARAVTGHPAKAGKAAGGAEAAKLAVTHPVAAAKLVAGGEATKHGGKHPVTAAKLVKALH